jgi:hypothetical protein
MPANPMKLQSTKDEPYPRPALTAASSRPFVRGRRQPETRSPTDAQAPLQAHAHSAFGNLRDGLSPCWRDRFGLPTSGSRQRLPQGC